MNQLHPSASAANQEARQARFARRVVARLSESADQLDGDIGERLRFARERALERARVARAASTAPGRVGVTAGGAAVLGGGPSGWFSGWWLKVASVVPLIALVCGLVLIQQGQTRAQISTAAEVDAALLSDDLPPTAYTDAGFLEFLKTPPRE
jgi:hypothetical protein